MNQYGIKCLSWLFLSLIAPLVSAGQSISGAVYDADSIVAVRNVRVTNQRTDIVTYTNRSGTYRIVAEDGDTLLFVHEGHRPHRVVVNTDRRELHEVIFLRKLNVRLGEVEITGNDRVRDSINRRQIYRKQLTDAERRPRVSRVRSTNIGFGVEIDGPLSYGIRKITGQQKKLEKFRNQLVTEEQDKYIRSRYTVALVKSLTNLDDLAAEQFILAHPMPYDFASQASDLELKAWIREQFRKGRPRKQSPIRSSQ